MRVPIKCSSLFSDATAATLIDTPVKFHLDETTNPVNITSVVARQAGDLVCLWGGPDRTDGGYDENLSVEIAPDASAGFAANIQAIESQASPLVKNTAGDESEYSCGAPGDFQCSSNMLVGSFWVSAYLQDLGNSTMPQAKANARIQQVLTAVAAALKGQTALPAWNPPGPVLPTFCSEASSTALVNQALGTTDFGVAGHDTAPADAESYAQQPDVYAQCTWSSGSNSGKFTYLAVGMVKGGAWVLPQLAGEQNDQDYMLGPFQSTTIPGADAAVETCNTGAQACDVMLSIGSLLVSVNTDDPSPALVTAALTKIVADIAGN